MEAHPTKWRLDDIRQREKPGSEAQSPVQSHLTVRTEPDSHSVPNPFPTLGPTVARLCLGGSQLCHISHRLSPGI